MIRVLRTVFVTAFAIIGMILGYQVGIAYTHMDMVQSVMRTSDLLVQSSRIGFGVVGASAVHAVRPTAIRTSASRTRSL